MQTTTVYYYSATILVNEVEYIYIIIIIIVDRTRSTHKHNKANVEKKKEKSANRQIKNQSKHIVPEKLI